MLSGGIVADKFESDFKSVEGQPDIRLPLSSFMIPVLG